MSRISLKIDAHVAKLKLNRPEKHNAFDPQMIKELTEAFSQFRTGMGPRLVILSGEGESFCAGGDLEWMKSMARFSHEENLADSRLLFKMFDTIRTCPLPVLAQAHGSIFGGGLGLLGAADIVAIEEGAKLCFSEVKIGLVPAVINPFVMRKMIPGRARELMLTARVFSAREAVDSGLAQFCGKGPELETYLETTTDQLLACGPEALRDTKDLVDFILENNWDQARLRCPEIIAERRVSDEGQEGMTAFFAKRSPNWKARSNAKKL